MRVADSFVAELDGQFGEERGPRGKASATDFIVIDLPAIVERFAAGIDELPEAVPECRPSGCSLAPRPSLGRSWSKSRRFQSMMGEPELRLAISATASTCSPEESR